MIMRANKAFSLMETLVAVVLASITALALLQAVSSSSKHCARIIETYGESLLSGLISSMISDNISDTQDAYELLQGHYTIDNPEISEALKSYTFTIKRFPAEIIDPMMGSDIRTSTGASLSGYTLSLQKIHIESPNSRKTIFRIGGGNL